jgi:hypothetical protein
VIAVKRLVKKLVLVALVVDALVAKKLVAVADVNTDDEPLRLAKVPVVLFRVEIVPEATVRDEMVVVASVEVPVATSDPVVVLLAIVADDAVSTVAVVVAKTVLPDTVRAVDEALPSVVCPFAVSAPVKDAVLP